jgi:hypothetical protein
MGKFLPPNPVAKPTVPSVASISKQKEPSTLIPQLVREVRYFSHRDMGVDIDESINLPEISQKGGCMDSRKSLPVSALDIVIVSS